MKKKLGLFLIIFVLILGCWPPETTKIRRDDYSERMERNINSLYNEHEKLLDEKKLNSQNNTQDNETQKYINERKAYIQRKIQEFDRKLNSYYVTDKETLTKKHRFLLLNELAMASMIVKLEKLDQSTSLASFESGEWELTSEGKKEIRLVVSEIHKEMMEYDSTLSSYFVDFDEKLEKLRAQSKSLEIRIQETKSSSLGSSYIKRKQKRLHKRKDNIDLEIKNREKSILEDREKLSFEFAVTCTGHADIVQGYTKEKAHRMILSYNEIIRRNTTSNFCVVEGNIINQSDEAEILNSDFQVYMNEIISILRAESVYRYIEELLNSHEYRIKSVANSVLGKGDKQNKRVCEYSVLPICPTLFPD